VTIWTDDTAVARLPFWSPEPWVPVAMRQRGEVVQGKTLALKFNGERAVSCASRDLHAQRGPVDDDRVVEAIERHERAGRVGNGIERMP
jgi:hypothetical protein